MDSRYRHSEGSFDLRNNITRELDPEVEWFRVFLFGYGSGILTSLLGVITWIAFK